MKKISIVTPTYNEEGNIERLVQELTRIMSLYTHYSYEIIVIDNCSQDNTPHILKKIANIDTRVKVIFNAKNFGWLRSPFYGVLQASGDAVIYLVSDFQEPPELIHTFIKKWEEGYKMIIGIKESSEESKFMFKIRSLFYHLITKISDETKQIYGFTGFGCYDKKIIDILRTVDDNYPYFRGLLTEYGYDIFEVKYNQIKREFGKTSSNFIRLYDVAMLGFTNHSKFPLRLSAFLGFFCSILSLLVALIYLILKLLFWDDYQIGFATITIGLFFFASVQLFFIGILGEYIGAINAQLRKRPLVVEKERINF